MKSLRVISLHFWLPVLVGVTFILSILIVIFNARQILESELTNRSIQFINIDLNALVQDMERELSFGNDNDANRALSIRGINTEYETLVAVDKQGRVQFTTHKIWLGQLAEAAIPHFDSNRFRETLEEREPDFLVSDDRRIITAYFPITLERHPDELRPLHVGALFLVYDLGYAMDAIWMEIWQSVEIPLLVGLLGFILLIAFLRSYATRPLRHLLSVTQRLAEGELGIESKLSGTGELAELGKSFNSMSRQLKENVEVLRRSEQRQQEIIWGTNVGTWEWNIQTGETIINDRWAEIIGYTLEELTPMDFDTWLALAHPDDLKRSNEQLKRHLSRELDYYKTETRFRHKNGDWVWVLDRGKVIEWIEDDKPLRMSGTRADISERKWAEEISVLENKVLEMLIGTSSMTEILDSINLGVEKIITGLFSSILLLDSDGTHLKYGSAPSLPSDYNQAVDGIEIGPNVGSCGTAAYFNKQVIVSDIAKDPLWANYRDLAQMHGLGACWSTPIRKSHDIVIGTFAIYSPVPKVPTQNMFELIDRMTNMVAVTIERKRAEKEIARFSRIFEDSLNEIYLFDIDSLKFVQANSAAQHNLGFSMEELQEMTPVDIKPEFTPESFAELLVPLRKGKKEIIVFETIHQRKDSSIYDVEVHLQLLKLDNEELFVAIILDITNKKKQEATLNQAQKMEAVGQLTGGIAHDFNNLLSIISGNLRFLRQDIGETSEDIDELFEDATSAVDDGAELTQRLLGFSRTRLLYPEYKNVNDTIEKSARFLSRTLADNTELETVLPDEALFINVDPSQLENALLNLSINARDAMVQGGTITISAERYYHGDGDEYSLSLPEGDYVKISVSDTGSGISPENLQHLFEPFYTTKEVGKGSGLGLSMVFGFTQQSKGSCHIDSTPGEGTTVSMYFPEVADNRNIGQKPEDEEELFLRGSEVILVVEDEPRVRRVALRDLRKLGYQTLEVENADMAKTIIESGEPVDLLFSDVLMPGEMDGHMLAVWTRENYPQIKILLTSGYSKGKTEVREDKKHPFPLLRKPYSSKNLARQIKTVLMNVS